MKTLSPKKSLKSVYYVHTHTLRKWNKFSYQFSSNNKNPWNGILKRKIRCYYVSGSYILFLNSFIILFQQIVLINIKNFYPFVSFKYNFYWFKSLYFSEMCADLKYHIINRLTLIAQS